MPSARLPIHGRDHRPGGIDPITFPSSAPNLSMASIDKQSVTVAPGGSFQPIDTPDFWTNDPATFIQDSTGSAGHSGGVLIQSQGVYFAWAWARAKVAAGGGAEPDTSWMSVRTFWYSYPASQFWWAPSDAGSQAKYGDKFVPGAQWWDMYDTDMSFYPPSDVTTPTQEYHVEVYNGGTQNMQFRVGLTVIRFSDAVDGNYPP